MSTKKRFTYTFRIEEEMHQALKEKSESSGRSVNNLLESAVKLYLEHEAADEKLTSANVLEELNDLKIDIQTLKTPKSQRIGETFLMEEARGKELERIANARACSVSELLEEGLEAAWMDTVGLEYIYSNPRQMRPEIEKNFSIEYGLNALVKPRIYYIKFDILEKI